ncbi:RipA family octameric membrane protein [Prevotella fusca]
MAENKGGISKEDYVNNFDEKKLEEAFQIALDTRKFEIDLYWKRTGYFVLFIGAVFVGYYRVLPISGSSDSKKEWLLLLLSSLGFLLSLLWYMANRGSKFWQENWEAHIEDLSIGLGKPVFGIIKCNEHIIYNPRHINKSYPFSVSKVNQMASLIITFSWLIILLKDLGLFLIFENNYFDLGKSFVAVSDFIWVYFIFKSCRSFVANVNIVESSDTSKKNKEKVYYFYNYDRVKIRQEDKLD